MARKGSFTTEVRRVDTGTTEGATADHTAYEYQLGATINGTFVPFVTKSGGYIDAKAGAGSSSSTDDGNGEGDGDGDDA
jgi:hypothetical protein